MIIHRLTHYRNNREGHLRLRQFWRVLAVAIPFKGGRDHDNTQARI
jgi:hypothetical protein